MTKKLPVVPPRASLADALFPKVRQRVLAVLFDAPERSFYVGEVIALAQSGTGAVQRELAGLAAAGLLTVTRQGKQKHYQANRDALVYDHISALVGKTMGVVNVLRSSLGTLTGHISAGFVYGPLPRVSDAQPQAITAVLFGDNVADVASAVTSAMQVAANTLGCQVSFSLFTPETLADAEAQDSRFVKRLMQGSKTWLMGSEDQLFSQPS